MTSNPICLITGATEGIGKATALALARKNFSIVLAARNWAKAERVRQEMKAAGGRDVEIVVGDLRGRAGGDRQAAAFRQLHPRLDVLINNAGIMAPERAVTADGFESAYQVNYLAPFVLTQLLLDDLGRSAQGRIINLGSSVASIGKFDPANLQGQRHFSAIGAYAASKLFVLMSTIELAGRLRGTRITANVAHPGVVNTHMLRSATGMFKLIALLARPFAVSPEKGAALPVRLATSPELATTSGQYFSGGKAAAFTSKFNTAENRARLWEISMASVHG
jgi:NAD(P)-dependent dehydrogenase (short-subunit alcohol dehydrogenase family)